MNTEFEALISLLDETDVEIYNEIEDSILSKGSEILPYLETAYENAFQPIVQERLQKLLHQIRGANMKVELEQWLSFGGKNLLAVTMMISRFLDVNMDEDKTRQILERLSQDVWLELNPNLTALEKIKVVNKVLFDLYGFEGNRKDYHNPENSLIHKVLENKAGNPLSLSIIYLLITDKLGLPVYGVNLPDHFILAYMPDEQLPGRPHEPIFYINPFSNGAMFTRTEIEQFLHHLKIDAQDSFFMPCNNQEIIKRMLRNLIHAYQKIGKKKLSEDLKEILNVLESPFPE